jgi:hypothetical protein
VQWVTADGTVMLCTDAEQLYEKFKMVVYDGKADGASEMVVYDGKTDGEGGDLQGAVGEVVVGGDEATIFVENPEVFCKQEPAME